jgi:hypothetical protein
MKISVFAVVLFLVVSRAFAGISLNPAFVDFGKVPEGRNPEASFVVSNDGKSAVRVEIHPSCGCISLDERSFRLAPGEAKRVRFAFRTAGYEGRVERIFSVFPVGSREPAALLPVRIDVAAKWKWERLFLDDRKYPFLYELGCLNSGSLESGEIVVFFSYRSSPDSRKQLVSLLDYIRTNDLPVTVHSHSLEDPANRRALARVLAEKNPPDVLPVLVSANRVFSGPSAAADWIAGNPGKDLSASFHLKDDFGADFADGIREGLAPFPLLAIFMLTLMLFPVRNAFGRIIAAVLTVLALPLARAGLDAGWYALIRRPEGPALGIFALRTAFLAWTGGLALPGFFRKGFPDGRTEPPAAAIPVIPALLIFLAAGAAYGPPSTVRAVIETGGGKVLLNAAPLLPPALLLGLGAALFRLPVVRHFTVKGRLSGKLIFAASWFACLAAAIFG